METLRTVMTVDEVAEYLRIPRASVYKLAQRGGIPCQKVGRHWRFRRQSVDDWLDEHGDREPTGAKVERAMPVAREQCQPNERH